MEIKEIPTLEQKQAFWAEQLPNFESIYWLPDHFDFLVFDIEQGNYVIKEDLAPSLEDDATEIWHRVNTGWAMWKKAIKFTEQQATPEGFVLVPRECPDPIFADKLFDHLCKKAHGEFGDDQMIFFSDIDESAIWQLMIEAQEQSHD